MLPGPISLVDKVLRGAKPADLPWPPTLCRYCCKSPKLPEANFPAVRQSDPRPSIDIASITLPRPPASLSSGDEVPHIFTRKSRLRPKEILITSAKRLLQQNLPGADASRCSKESPYSITSSAATSNPGGTVTPSAFAVLRLRTVSNLVAACTGSSAGLSPRRMRST